MTDVASSVEKPKMGCAKMGLIGLGVFVVLGIIGSVIGEPTASDAGSDKAASTEAKSTAAAPIEVTATALQSAYEVNEAAAQQKFSGAQLRVTGTILAIDLDFANKPVLRLVGTNAYIGPQASLDEASQARAPELTKGQKVTLLCEKVGEVIGTPMLDNCALQ